MKATRNKRKRDKRRKYRNIRIQSPANKWTQLEAILDHCKEALAYASKNNDWNNLDWPPGWSYEKWRFLRDYAREKLENHHQGRMNRIMGGPKQTEAFNEWLFDMCDILHHARQEGILPDER
jgi:hypothetical protein